MTRKHCGNVGCDYCNWHRGWHIEYSPPPIPDRRHDWQATDMNSDGLMVTAPNFEELTELIDAVIAEREHLTGLDEWLDEEGIREGVECRANARVAALNNGVHNER